MKCGSCGEEGHRRNSKKCPNYQPPDNRSTASSSNFSRTNPSNKTASKSKKTTKKFQRIHFSDSDSENSDLNNLPNRYYKNKPKNLLQDFSSSETEISSSS